MSNGYIVLDKNACPDPLEALKPFGEPIKCFKIEGRGAGVGGGWGSSLPFLWPPYALRGILTYVSA